MSWNQILLKAALCRGHLFKYSSIHDNETFCVSHYIESVCILFHREAGPAGSDSCCAVLAGLLCQVWVVHRRHSPPLPLPHAAAEQQR